MIVTFKTKAYADITLFGNVAVHLLKLMGHSGTVPGAIQAEDVNDYKQRLEQAVNNAKLSDEDNTESEDDDNPPVSISKRALPLIELFDAAAKANADIMWE